MARNPLTEHPHAVGETYGEHFRVAMGVSRQLAGASVAAFIHAVVPGFHEITASAKIRSLNRWLDSQNRDAPLDP